METVENQNLSWQFGMSTPESIQQTSAHTWQDHETGGIIMRAKSWSCHPDHIKYSWRGLSSDVGITKLSKPILNAEDSKFAQLAPEGLDLP